MFITNVKEEIENEVQIDEVKPQVMAELLHYIYTGKCYSLNKDIAGDLFVAASKYQINSLKDLSEKVVISSIDNANYFSFLLLGHNYSSKIKKSVFDFVVRNKNQIKFEESLKEYPSLIMELLREMASEKI